MDLNDIPLMNALTRKMDWLNRRQRVISTNVANADTPNYRAKDIEPQSFRDLLDKAPRERAPARPRLIKTHAAHMGPGGASATVPSGEKFDRPYEGAPNGNNVILEEQVMKMAETQTEYGLMINLYRKHVGLLRASLGRGDR